MVWSPGSPKTCSTPSRASWRARAWPPVIRSVASIGIECICYPSHAGASTPAARPGRVPAWDHAPVRDTIGIVAVAFGPIDVAGACALAADLGFDHVDAGVGGIEALSSEELAALPVPIGDRIGGF